MSITLNLELKTACVLLVYLFSFFFFFNLTGAMDIEERNRQMKMSKYKQVAGSDSRLEQDYHSKAREFCFEKQQNMLN